MNRIRSTTASHGFNCHSCSPHDLRMKSPSKLTAALILLPFLSSCGTTHSGPASEAPTLLISHVDARDDMQLVPPTGGSGTVRLQDLPGAVHREGPYLSVGRKCNAARTVCKLGIVKVWLNYTSERVGTDWVITGELAATVSRSATVSAMGTSISRSIPPEVALIDDEPTQPQHFRWTARVGESIELQGPVGVKFRLERRDAN